MTVKIPAPEKKSRLRNALDFACGSGSRLINVRKQFGVNGIGQIYGQEKNITTYNLARMNMLLHGVKDSEFQIHHGDSLLNRLEYLKWDESGKKMQFEAVVANPSFSYRWQPKEEMAEDFRFKNYGIAPKLAADFAFLLHGFHFLSDNGTMAICSVVALRKKSEQNFSKMEILTLSLACLRTCFSPQGFRYVP